MIRNVSCVRTASAVFLSPMTSPEVKYKMRKLLLLLCLPFAAMLFFMTDYDHAEANEAYFYQINSVIKDEDFTIAKVEDYKIMLYNAKNELQKEILFDGYDAGIKQIYIHKEGPVIYFVTGGAVDDEQGVLFINDASNQILDGIASIKRIGGNSYQYSTRK